MHESKAESLSEGALSPVSLEKGGPVVVPEKTWAKIDLYVLPVITLMYFLSSLVGVLLQFRLLCAALSSHT